MSNFQSLASRLFAFEEGQLDEEETLALFQELVDSAMIQELQGSHQRTAQAYIDAGLITPPADDQDALDILPASQ